MNNWLLGLVFLLCVAAGVIGYLADTHLNVEHIQMNGGSQGIIIATYVIAFCSALSLTACALAHKSKKYLTAALCFVGFIASMCWSAPVSLDRFGSVFDRQYVAVNSHNSRLETLNKAYKDAVASRKKEEANGGCRGNCQALMKREDTIMAQLLAVGAKKTGNAAGERLQLFTGFLDADTVRMLVPGAAVLSLICLMNGLLSFGVTGLVDLAKRESIETVTPEVLVPLNDPILGQIVGERTISELAEMSGKSVPFVSTYVTRLEEQGVVTKERQGRSVIVKPV